MYPLDMPFAQPCTSLLPQNEAWKDHLDNSISSSSPISEVDVGLTLDSEAYSYRELKDKFSLSKR